MIVGHMVTHNEEGRYLRDSLWWLNSIVDRTFVWDDQSTDDTIGIADVMNTEWAVRPDSVPSFAEDEGRFRQAGWEWMVGQLPPEAWVLCVDADEFVVADEWARKDERELLEETASFGFPAEFPVAEVFAVHSGAPQVRKDGYWDSITALRFVPATAGPFRPMVEGCGSVPAEFFDDVPSLTKGLLTILHYGYARPEDRKMKHDRYAKGRGHNPLHVASILKSPNLVPWSGKVPMG